MSESDEKLGADCGGCGTPLTIINAGGYQNFCEKCVDALPEFPNDGEAHYIEGQYPDFRWV